MSSSRQQTRTPGAGLPRHVLRCAVQCWVVLCCCCCCPASFRAATCTLFCPKRALCKRHDQFAIRAPCSHGPQRPERHKGTQPRFPPPPALAGGRFWALPAGGRRAGGQNQHRLLPDHHTHGERLCGPSHTWSGAVPPACQAPGASSVGWAAGPASLPKPHPGLANMANKHASCLRAPPPCLLQPPELLMDGEVSPATDVYSFGVLLHEA